MTSASRLFAPARCIAVAFLISAVASCGGGDSSNVTGPPTPTKRIAIGDTVTVAVSGSSASVHSFTAAGGQQLLVLGAISSGNARVVVTDSATGAPAVDWTYLGPVTLDHGVSPSFNATTSVYLVTVTTDPGASVTLKYIVHLIDATPESNPAQLSYGSAIVEPLQPAYDQDDFFFDGVAGEEVIGFLQGVTTTVPGIFYMSVARDSTTTVLGSTYGHSGDADPQTNTTGRITLPSTGRYRVHVETDPARSALFVGTYQLEIDRINRAPEHTAAAVVPGDTITGEAIEKVGDIDEFKLNAAIGEEYNIFLQTTAGPATNSLILELLDPAGSLLNSIRSFGTDTLKLMDNGIGRFRIATAGVHTIRVRGYSDLAGLNRGPYRVFVHKVNRHPETISASPRVLGDTIAGESIEVPGDVDEIPVNIASTTLMHIETLRYAGPTYSTLTTELRRTSDDSLIVFNNNYLDLGETAPKGNGTGTPIVAPGSYTLRVYGDSRQFGYHGAWRAILQKIDSMPEGHAFQIAGGDTVASTIDPPGDFDVYRMAVRAGEHYQIFFQGEYNGGSGLLFQAKTDSTLLLPDVVMYGLASSGLDDAQHSDRLDVSKNLNYQITVGPSQLGLLPSQRGQYRFTVRPFSGVVETHSPNLAPGDSVIDEKIDYPFDLDQYTLAGAPGQECIIDLRASPSSTVLPFWVRVIDTTTHTVLTQMESFVAVQTTQRFRLPASGQVRVEAFETDQGVPAAPYFLKVSSINRAPESVPAAYAVGDTVSGESLEFTGDIDEFHFTGTAGQQVRIYLQIANGDETFYGARAEISVAGSDISLTDVIVTNPDLLLVNGSPTISLPASGAYVARIRYQQEGTFASPLGYRFVVVNVP